MVGCFVSIGEFNSRLKRQNAQEGYCIYFAIPSILSVVLNLIVQGNTE